MPSACGAEVTPVVGHAFLPDHDGGLRILDLPPAMLLKRRQRRGAYTSRYYLSFAPRDGIGAFSPPLCFDGSG
eukprot:330293-Chlamydomonas_euryale.AAC.4